MTLPVLQSRGRPRNEDAIRDSKGKSRGEAVESVVATALAPMLRSGITHQEAFIRDSRTGEVIGTNQDVGHVLGKLKLLGSSDPGGISVAQYETGMLYAQLTRRHASIMGYSTGSTKSPSFTMVSGGLTCKSEPDDEVILKCRREFSDCYRVLMDIGVQTRQNVRIATTTYDVCLDRFPFFDLQRDTEAMGNLRMGLNVLARVLR